MKAIISSEPVFVPDGKGGIREKFFVNVPAMQNEQTGDIFLGDEALSILDRKRDEAIARYAIQDLITAPATARKFPSSSVRRVVTINLSFGAGEPPEVDSAPCDSSRELAFA